MSGAGAYTHMTILAQSTTGMHNLFRLSSLSSMEGYYFKPRMDRELLNTYGKGIIATTGCPSGEVQTRLRLGQYDKAVEAAVGSRNSLAVGRAVTINSVVSGKPSLSRVSGKGVTESQGMSAVLIEHSLLTGVAALPESAVVSHLCAPLGLNLAVQDDIMLQKIYLRCGGSGVSADPSLVPFTLLVLGIRDDVKACFSDLGSTVCGSTWQNLFKVRQSTLLFL